VGFQVGQTILSGRGFVRTVGAQKAKRKVTRNEATCMWWPKDVERAVKRCLCGARLGAGTDRSSQRQVSAAQIAFDGIREEASWAHARRWMCWTLEQSLLECTALPSVSAAVHSLYGWPPIHVLAATDS